MPAISSESGPVCAQSGPGQFRQTHWSVVLKACDRGSSEARDALEKLCRAYWLPLYAFVRRQGASPHDAQDLTQAFFERVLEKDYLKSAHPDRGRFRSFLLAALKHFLSNERDKARAKKRGAGQVPISIDSAQAETQYSIEPVDPLTPERIFERRWATALLDRTLVRLRGQYTAQGKSTLFEQLKTTLAEPRPAESYAVIAGRLGLTEAAVKMAVHRLRERYRQVLRDEVAETVANSEEVEDELRQVLRVLTD